jgi:hypothetical protein
MVAVETAVRLALPSQKVVSMGDWKEHRPAAPVPAAKPESVTAADRKPLASRAEALERLGDRLGVPRGDAIACLVLDCSSSMAEERKLAQAKQGVVEFADSAFKKGYSVVLVGFADQTNGHRRWARSRTFRVACRPCRECSRHRTSGVSWTGLQSR